MLEQQLSWEAYLKWEWNLKIVFCTTEYLTEKKYTYNIIMWLFYIKSLVFDFLVRLWFLNIT